MPEDWQYDKQLENSILQGTEYGNMKLQILYLHWLLQKKPHSLVSCMEGFTSFNTTQTSPSKIKDFKMCVRQPT